MTQLADAITPIVTAMREHPFLMELWRRDNVILFGDRLSSTHIFWNVNGDTELWVDYVGPGLYEGWGSDRGRRSRLWRTNSVDGIITELARTSSAAFANDLTPGCPFHRAPVDVRFENAGPDHTVASWGEPSDEEWIEYPNAHPAYVLEFAQMLTAPKRSVQLRAEIVMARGGGYSTSEHCGPTPLWQMTVDRWRQWLATDPPCTWQGSRPVL